MPVLPTMFLRPLLALLFQCLFIVPVQIVRLDKEDADEEGDTGAGDHKVVDVAYALSCEAG